ncbi:hypothetical protein [Haloferax marisrubri]|uniref:Uncharacterized protein n=1 Tax=Haloferax marisrubri TaxID=1544719 RepID=A0A2P4NQW9_9EURY|nr:hypothetical protein [Haloferax marisrubri]POG55468.1 hypothetical protein AUR65_008625 [Haloferax marisrubri]
MVATHYEVGETVPVDICSVPAEEEEITFAVPVDVYDGYGSAKHVYPTEQVERIWDLFVTNGETDEVVVADEVRLYTIPHDALR